MHLKKKRNLLNLKLKSKASVTFIGIWFSFVFSSELLKLTLLLERYPEPIQSDAGTRVLGQDEKGSLFCNTGNHVKLPLPPLPGQIYFFSSVEGWQSTQTIQSFILLCGLKAPLLLCSAHTPPRPWKRSTTVLQKERGHAWAPTKTSKGQQRTCGSLSLSSQLPL